MVTARPQRNFMMCLFASKSHEEPASERGTAYSCLFLSLENVRGVLCVGLVFCSRRRQRFRNHTVNPSFVSHRFSRMIFHTSTIVHQVYLYGLPINFVCANLGIRHKSPLGKQSSDDFVFFCP